MKKIKKIFNLLFKAGKAIFEDSNVGPVLSPFLMKDKVNKLCGEFNLVTVNYYSNLIIRVKLFLYNDNSFFFLLKGPSFFNLLKILINFNKLNNNENFLFLTELYDIIYCKNFFLLNKVSLNFNLLIKREIFYCIHSIKDLKIKNEFI